MISSKLATLRELDEVYGIEDLYALIEVAVIDGRNRDIVNEANAKKEH